MKFNQVWLQTELFASGWKKSSEKFLSHFSRLRFGTNGSDEEEFLGGNWNKGC